MRPRIISLTFLMIMALTIMAQSIQKHQYWLDSDFDHHKTVYGSSLLSVTVSIEGLSPGVHFFNHRAMDSDDTWGTIYRTLFYIPSDPTSESTIQSYEYWIDSDYEYRKSGSGSTSMQATVDISSLSAGVHFFNYRALSSNGSWGTIYRTLFYIPSDPTSESTIQNYEYWIDSDYDNRKSGSGSTSMQATIDISSLAAGVHFFNYRALSSNGSWGTIYRTLFYIPEWEIENPEIVEYEYWIDDDSENKLSGTGNMDTYQLTIDVSQLAAGEHLFSFRAKNTNGEWSQLYQSTFTVDEPPAVETIVFADANVKAICVANWDTNGDGELSMDEAAVVSSLGDVFRNKDITSFDELQYFTGLTTIENRTFFYCGSLTSIFIPNGVTTIGEGAFYACSSLISIVIPSNVISIGEGAFNGCSALTSISVESSNTVYDSRGNCNAIIKTATNELVEGCKKTIIPNSVTSIGDYAFDGCLGLTSITIPDGVTTIGESAFNWCTDLTSVTIGNGVKSIGEDAFCNCSNLTAVHISDLKVWCNIIFSKRNWLLSNAQHLFLNGIEVTDLVIPDGVTAINSCAFEYCSGLTSVIIPNSVTLIDDGAFWGCYNLTTVTIPNSVTTLGDAFNDCYDIKTIVSMIEEPFALSASTFTNAVYNTATLIVPTGTKAKYQVTGGWWKFKHIVEMEPENTPGDLSGDNEVNGTDLVMLTQLVLNAEYNAVADLNNDGVVNGTDFVLMVNIILNINPATAREESRTKALTAGLAIEDFTIRAGETRKMLISLINPDTRITLGQFDLRLPTGLSIVSEDGEIAVSIAGRTSERRHALSTLTRDGVTRFLLASDMNEPVSGTDGAVISVTVTASSDFCGGDILLENQLLVTPEADEIKPFTYTYTLGAVTGVCASAVDGYVEVFTMTGSKVNTGGGGLKALPKGVYIVNGKKVIVK